MEIKAMIGFRWSLSQWGAQTRAQRVNRKGDSVAA
jgi:hypothetical protein